MRHLLAFILTFSAVASSAQDATPATKTFWDDPISHPLMPIYLVTGFIFLVIVLVAFVAIYLLKVLNMLTEEAERERAKQLGVAYTPKPTWFQRWAQRLNASVPVEQERNIELDHSYDGIKELDNHLPPWWKWLFYSTIAFGAVYLVVFHVTTTLPSQEDEYNNEVAMADEASRKLRAAQPQLEIDLNTLVFSPDAAIIQKGKSVFSDNNCGSCHRPDGGGNTIGPNLTDEYWLHGGDVKQVFSTIKNGVVEKGMPAWGRSLSPESVRDVTFFILSLQGSNPTNAKAPQGNLFKQTPVSGDSTKAQASL